MAVSKITLQVLNLEIANCKKQDLQKKLDIAVNIVKRGGFDRPIEDLDDVADLTGVPGQTLEKVKQIEESNINLNDCLREQEIVYYNVSYNKIRECLVTHYTHAHEIPTKKRLLRLVKKKGLDNLQIEGYLNKFFTYLKLPQTEGAIVVEKPETIRKRFHYFDTKLKYQKEKRNMVYVAASRIIHKYPKIEVTGRMYGHGRMCLMAVSTKTGYMHSTFANSGDFKAVKTWIFDKVVPLLTPGSVLIFCEKLYVEDEPPPEKTATKKEMCNWLLKQDIPHDPSSHKAELYLLIEYHKRPEHYEASRMKDYLSARGHKILLKPREVESWFFDDFWKHLHKLLVSQKCNLPEMQQKILYIASSFSVKYWRNLEAKILDKDLKEFKNDLQVEVVIDKMLAYTKNEGLTKKMAYDIDPFPKHMEEEYLFFRQKQLTC